METKLLLSTDFKYQLDALVEVAVSLSAENNLNRLLEKIITYAREITGSDGGTLYLLQDETLHFKIIQNKSLNIFKGDSDSSPIGLDPVPLDKSNVCAYAAILVKTVIIDDVYDSKEFDFSGPKKYDAVTGYRSKSMLVVPMKNHLGVVTGVLQLMNATDPDTGNVITYPGRVVALVEAMASLAAVAIQKTKLLEDTKNLFQSIIEVLGVAIDAKSHYTGNHIQRVAMLNLEIARAINNDKTVFADIKFNDSEMEEIRLSGWLHDIGKVTTPEWVMDKSKKLQKVIDRIELIQSRFDIARDYFSRICASDTAAARDYSSFPISCDEAMRIIEELENDFALIKEANQPTEWMDDDTVKRLEQIAARRYLIDGREISLIDDDEFDNLSIRKGSLNAIEIEAVKEHAAYSVKMLDKLKFPEHLKNVPLYACQHHEKLNGKGYPFELTADKIPFQSRLLAIADLYEALSSNDRPYKKKMPYTQIVEILEKTANNGEIDRRILDFCLKNNLFLIFEEKYNKEFG